MPLKTFTVQMSNILKVIYWALKAYFSSDWYLRIKKAQNISKLLSCLLSITSFFKYIGESRQDNRDVT